MRIDLSRGVVQQSSLGGARRRRRGAEGEEPEGGGARKTALVIGGGKKPSATFDCASSRCVNLLCPLDGLTGAGTVTLRTRVWNSTFLEVSSVSAQVRLTLDPDGTVTPSAPIPWWVIALSVAAGVFVLLLLVVLLWKCGFFKRTSKEMRYEAKLHKAKIGAQPSETNRLTAEEDI
ncbi:unnamed protein product [Lampetra planeri]